MLLKRLHDEQKKVRGVRVLRAGEKQHFSPDLVLKAQAEGWMVMADGKITIKGEAGDVVYRIVREPGYYCCHDGAPMPDGEAARSYIAEKFPGKPSTDRNNPSGYARIHHFECVKE